MNKPILLVIAGCNGSGKSSFSKAIAGNLANPFDYDKSYLSIYNSLQDIDVKDRMAHNKTRSLLEQNIETAISKKSNFCYETNFNSTPLHWPEYFRKFGYQIDLYFLCLDSIVEAKKRVMIRVENGGHFVPPAEVEKRFFEGYANLDSNYTFFDNIHLLDVSGYNKEPNHIVSIAKGKVIKKSSYPEFLKLSLPKITQVIKHAEV